MPRLEIRKTALVWLSETNAVIKAAGVQAFGLNALDYKIEPHVLLSTTLTIPGCPEKPVLVSPLNVKKRNMRTVEGRAALVHALAHIEFNAINLALDAIWRFNEMPESYYLDWLKVAKEEAYHFSLLNLHLASLGFQYGDFTGHNSLWEMVDRTKGDVLARMALVPRTMEARGLDANPALRNKLAQAGDVKAAAIMDIILADEIGHVAIGNYWFNYLCEKDNLEPLTTFAQLCDTYSAPKLRGPFNLEARRKAGFSEAELLHLTQV
ncbi:MAG TPA: ferritin-like domain-containing protein [Methylotenera sp.]|nr:ferritin-like domain-containing protein [Methylotenera sp.]